MLFSAGLVIAIKPNLTPKPVEVTPSNGNAKVVIPAHAVEVAPGIFHLGSVQQNGKTVEGYVFVDYRKGYGKPGTECGNGVCEPSENKNNCPQDCGNGSDDQEEGSDCYGFLSKEAKWRNIEPYIVNPSNNSGLTDTFILSNLEEDIVKWETAAGTNILGSDSNTSETLTADTENPDGKNEVYFGSIEESGAIAITIVWGVFRGKPSDRRLVEWDQVDFGWSSSGETGKMDFENIATHELGHSVGMDDLYEDKCSEQTMYGYATNGETKKRTLEAGDITGIKELYGS